MGVRVAWGVLIVLTLFCIGSFIYPVSPYELDAHAILEAPTLMHPFGTDLLGRDVMSRMMQGGSISLFIGFTSSLVSIIIGLFVGLIAAYFRGIVDKATLIVIDLFLTFPTFFLLLALVAYMEASILVLIIVLSVTSWMGLARTVRANALQYRAKPYIKILQMGDVSRKKILFKYIAPLMAPLLGVGFALGMSGAIIAESGLSFLGLGVLPPLMSWGSILSEGKEVLAEGWWLSFFPGMAIFLVSFSLVILADHYQNRTNEA
jgi:peptide/nickel transport system permease protein